MTRSVRIAEIVHAVSLGVWLGVILTAAFAAAILFPIMRQLDPTLGAYPAFQGDHAPLAGGRIAARIFLFADLAGFICLMLAGLSTLVWTLVEWPRRPKPAAIRSTLLLALVLVFGYTLIVHGSRLNQRSNLYWAAADAGQTVAAEQHRSAIRDMHPTSRNLMATTAVLALASLLTGLWCATTAAPPTRDAPNDPPHPDPDT